MSIDDSWGIPDLSNTPTETPTPHRRARRVTMTAAASLLALGVAPATAAHAASTQSITATGVARSEAVQSKAVQSGAVQAAEQQSLFSSNIQIRFRNNTSTAVWVALMYRDYSGSCDAYGGWATKGWWQLSPGEMKHVLNTTNRYVYWFATGANGRQWSSTDHHMYVNWSAGFQGCQKLGVSTWNYVGLRTIHVGAGVGTHTTTLT